MKLHPRFGIEPHFRFGVTRSSLEAVLGRPTRVVMLERHDHDREQLEYDELQVSLRLYDGRLAWIESEAPSLEWRGQLLMRMPIGNAVRLSMESGLGDPEITDHGSFSVYFWDTVWLELQTTYSRVSRVNMGALIEPSSGEYLWPTQGTRWEDA